MKHFFFFAVVLVLTASGCLKIETFPDEPSLEFKELVFFDQDSLHFVVEFTDGNGDLGVLDPDDEDEQNLFVDIYEQQDGVWVKLEGELNFYYPIPYAEPTGQNPTQRGEIKLRLDYDGNIIPSEYPTTRFSAYVVDRAGNESNTVFSNSFEK